jgi:HK97 family phage prohead protease
MPSAPEFMRANAKRGLKYHEEGLSGDGLKPQTVEDARSMASGNVTDAKWRKIAPWIARHMVDLESEGVKEGDITAGMVAHLLWGSGTTKAEATRAMQYAERVVERLDEERSKLLDSRTTLSSFDNIRNTMTETNAMEGDACPVATQDVELNLTNRGKAIRVASYGPLNPAEPNDSFWQDKADRWDTSIDEARTALCGNCAAFDTSDSMKSCIEEGLSGESDDWNAVDAGDLGYCEVFDFKCASARTCNAWIAREADDDEADEDLESDDYSMKEDEPMEMNSINATPTNNWVVCDETETRRVAFSNMEVRASQDGTKLIGYAAVFDSPSEPLPFTEFVRRGAFTKTLNDGADVRLLIDHEGVPLARTKSGTLVLTEDDRGLLVESDLDPSNPDAARLISALRRGDISQMSFAFRTVKDNWSDDRRTRELREVQLFDVSVVTFPAYEKTVAELRAKQDVATIIATNTLSLRKRQIEIARHK